jgi:hypothetical protein
MKEIIQKIAFWAALGMGLCMPAHAGENLLANSGFVPNDPSIGCCFIDNHGYGSMNAPSWTFTSGQITAGTSFPNGSLPNNIFLNDPDSPTTNPVPIYKGNSYFFDLGGYGTPDPDPGDSVQQTFSTIAGHKYRLTFGHSSEANGLSVDYVTADTFESGKDSIRVQVGDQDMVFDSPYQAGYPNYGLKTVAVGAGGAWQMPWVERSFVFTASGASTTVKFSVNEVSVNNYAGGAYQERNGANSQMIAMPLVAELPPTLIVNKALGGAGRLSATDQFTVYIKSGSSVVNDVTHSTTLGSGLDITAGSGTTGVFTAVADTTATPSAHVVGEDPATGSTTVLGQYSSSMACVNTSAAADKTTFPASLPVPSTIRLKDSDVVTCTITNSPGAPRLTIKKNSLGGIGEFHFKGTAANHNGFTTDNSYFVTTTTAGTAAPGTTVTLTAANTLTEIQETVPAGWTLTGATCVDVNAASDGNTKGFFGAITGTTLTLPAVNMVPGSDIQCTFTNTSTGFTLSGKVLTDTGVGSGTAHDGIQNGSEPGHSGVLLSLTNCSATLPTVYSTTTSGGDGSFSLSLTGVPTTQPVCLVESLPSGYNAVSVNVGTTAGTYTSSTTTLQFTPAASTNYSGVVLGDAPVSTFVSDGALQTSAGQSVLYAHVYVPGSAGDVTFTTIGNPTPPVFGWSSVLYRDGNCNGTLDDSTTDPILPSVVHVNAGEPVCILEKVTSPPGSANGAQDITTVKAIETWAVQTFTPPTLTHTLTNTDTTTVSAGGLSLLKDVRKVTTCPADAAASLADSTAYASSGRAGPGDILEYRLRYSDNTATPLTGIKLFDMVPPYTQFKRALCLTLPTRGIAACAVSQQPALNAVSGPVGWTMTDASIAPIGLQPLDSGSVSFCVQVQSN